jgi:hypothetical protein
MRLSKPMDDQIRVRVGRDEKRRLAEFARQRGVTLSDLLRVSASEAARRTAA